MNAQDRIVKEYTDKIRNRKTAIRAFCVQCMGGYIAEIPKCTSKDCALYDFRMGKDPFNTRPGPVRVKSAPEMTTSERNDSLGWGND